MTESVTSIPEQPNEGGQGRRLLKIAVIVAALVVSLWYALRGVEWGTLWEAIRRVNAIWILVSVTATMSAHLARAQRWRILIPEGKKIHLLNSYSSVLIGYMMNNIIPRSGELVRPYVLARREGRSFSSLLATVLVERILDGVALALLFVLLLFVERRRLEELLASVSRQLDIGLSPSGVLLALGVPIVALILLFVLAVRTPLGDRMVSWAARRFPGRLTERLRNAFEEFRAGVNFSGPTGTAWIVFWSIVIWACYAFSLYFGFLAFGFDARYGMGLGAMVTVLAITTVGITIAPTPGAFGVYHLFSKLALVMLYSVSDEDAVAFALVLHAAPYLATLIAGGIFFLREGVSLSEVRSNRSADESNAA